MGNVVITGGSRGIGAAAVELFAARGDRVTFLYEKNHAAASRLPHKSPENTARPPRNSRFGQTAAMPRRKSSGKSKSKTQITAQSKRTRICTKKKRATLGRKKAPKRTSGLPLILSIRVTLISI